MGIFPKPLTIVAFTLMHPGLNIIKKPAILATLAPFAGGAVILRKTQTKLPEQVFNHAVDFRCETGDASPLVNDVLITTIILGEGLVCDVFNPFSSHCSLVGLNAPCPKIQRLADGLADYQMGNGKYLVLWRMVEESALPGGTE